MEQNRNGLDWFMNVLKRMEDRCLEMCDVLEKEVLKYVEGQSDTVTVGVDEGHSHLDDRDEYSEKRHQQKHNSSSAVAFTKFPGVFLKEKHHIETERQTIQSSEKQNHRMMEPNHLSVYPEISGTQEIEKENGKANVRRLPKKQSQKATAVVEEKVEFTQSAIQNDDFPDWEII